MDETIIYECENAIIVNAVKSGSEQGAIHQIDLSNDTLDSNWFHKSSHLFDLLEAYTLSKTLHSQTCQ